MPTDCICDYDCEGDPPSYVRCNPSLLCPEHDDCEACGERKAIAIIAGHKVCAECQQIRSGGAGATEMISPSRYKVVPCGRKGKSRIGYETVSQLREDYRREDLLHIRYRLCAMCGYYHVKWLGTAPAFQGKGAHE